jgi:putative pyruvate formate lyase activating enzyme
MSDLPDNIEKLKEMLKACRLCPRACTVDRTAGERGACMTGMNARVSSAMGHFGEEPVLVGKGGSGTIFFSGCNLGCVFCQNYDISQADEGTECSSDEIVKTALRLERQGCENINFVSPTHVTHVVAEVIVKARGQGLRVPVVFNCGGYESVETLMLLEGLVEIYMPDFKYADEAAGRKYSGVREYPAAARAALKEMYRQVGPLKVNAEGVAQKGVLVRHLVMPHDIAQSKKVIEIVARTAPGCAINVMGQYRPAYRAGNFPELMDCPSDEDVRMLREYAGECGLVRDGIEH